MPSREAIEISKQYGMSIGLAEQMAKLKAAVLKNSTPEKRAEFESRRIIDEEREKAISVEQAKRDADIPLIFKNALFANWEHKTPEEKRVLDLAKKYVAVRKYKLNMILVGKSGRGKSRIAATVLNELIEYGEECFFCMATEITDNIVKAKSVEWLVIDDIGLGNSSDFRIKTAIISVMSRRYYNSLPTIITTNNEKEELEKVLPAAIRFRLWEKAVNIDFSGISNKRDEKGVAVNKWFNEL